MKKEQRFLYTRIAILVLTAGWVGFAISGFSGFMFWNAGFGLCFWIAFGLVNYSRRTSLWLLRNRRLLFLTFYLALAGSFTLIDQLALRAHLWFYPFYTGFWLIFVYGILYPVAALALIELFYFLAHLSQEGPTWKQRAATAFHIIVDVMEGALFLLMMMLIALGGALYAVPISMLFILSAAWMFFAAVKLCLHIAHPPHILLLLLITGVAAAFFNELPNSIVFEWIYIEAPFLNAVVLNTPLWIWAGWLWYSLFVFRLWTFLVLRPRVK